MRRLLALAPMLMILPLAEAQAQSAPQGSYRKTCQNEEQRGPIVSAVCRGRHNSRYETEIDLRRCRGEDISNSSGRLTCGRAQGYARPLDGEYRGGPQDDSARRRYGDEQGDGYGQPQRGYGYRNDDQDDPSQRHRPRYYDPDQD